MDQPIVELKNRLFMFTKYIELAIKNNDIDLIKILGKTLKYHESLLASTMNNNNKNEELDYEYDDNASYTSEDKNSQDEDEDEESDEESDKEDEESDSDESTKKSINIYKKKITDFPNYHHRPDIIEEYQSYKNTIIDLN